LGAGAVDYSFNDQTVQTSLRGAAAFSTGYDHLRRFARQSAYGAYEGAETQSGSDTQEFVLTGGPGDDSYNVC